MSASGGEAPKTHNQLRSSAFCPRFASVFVHWALGLGGLAGALGARPAALQHKGIPYSCLLMLLSFFDENLVSKRAGKRRNSTCSDPKFSSNGDPLQGSPF